MSELKLNKLKMQTPDICEENIKKLKELDELDTKSL